MRAISVGGYVMITLIMLAVTIQTLRIEQIGVGAISFEANPAVHYWGR